MDWFERLMGFKEATGPAGYEATRSRLEVDGRQLRSRVNGRGFGIGELELVSLRNLRQRAERADPVAGRRRLRIVQGEVGKMHGLPEYSGAVFQVASQFNLLEMIGPSVTPEDGVARYEHDRTQGPACAIAAGAATIYRNYFAPVGDAIGQTRDRQIDGFADLGAAITRELGKAEAELWSMWNGYAMFTRSGLDAMSSHVASLEEDDLDGLRQRLVNGPDAPVVLVTGAAGGIGGATASRFLSGGWNVGAVDITEPAPFESRAQGLRHPSCRRRSAHRGRLPACGQRHRRPLRPARRSGQRCRRLDRGPQRADHRGRMGSRPGREPEGFVLRVRGSDPASACTQWRDHQPVQRRRHPGQCRCGRVLRVEGAACRCSAKHWRSSSRRTAYASTRSARATCGRRCCAARRMQWRTRRGISPTCSASTRRADSARFITPAEVAELIWFLAQPHAAPITGANISIDFGLSSGIR